MISNVQEKKSISTNQYLQKNEEFQSTNDLS